MKFVTIRDLRGQSSDLWSRLAEEGQLVITNHGKPVAILSSVGEDNLEETLHALRRSLAAAAVESLQQVSLGRGLNELTPTDIDNEIRLVRKRRRS